MKLFAAAVLLATCVGATGAIAAERRCGWLMNPTPANWWLTDRDGTWTLMTQGMEPSDDVMLNLPDFDEDEYVASNGNYGYGCACLTVDIDRAEARIIRTYAGKILPLRRCRADRSLPPAE